MAYKERMNERKEKLQSIDVIHFVELCAFLFIELISFMSCSNRNKREQFPLKNDEIKVCSTPRC